MQKRKKLKEKVLFLALSAAMVTTMMSTTAFATDGGSATPDVDSVGRQSRSSTSTTEVDTADELRTAFTNATDGTTIKVTAAIDLGQTGVKLDKSGASVTLDLNGKTITYSGTNNAITISAGSLEITDTGTNGTVNATTGYAIFNAGNVTVSGGTVSAISGSTIYNNSNGSVTVSGGTVSATTGYAIHNREAGPVTVSGGEVSATTGYAIFNNKTGAVTVSNGTVSATTGVAIHNHTTGPVTVSGGTVSAAGRFGYAIGNIGTGLITISQDPGKTTLVTSANRSGSSNQGTIYLEKVPTGDPKTVLKVLGGTVSNTAQPEKYSVYFKDTAVTVANLADYYAKASDATVGRVYPEPVVYTGTQAAAPSSTPTEKKATSVKLAPVTVSGETVEYAYSTSSTAPTDDSKWQDSIEFTGLTANTEYYFFARVKANDNHKAGSASTGTLIKTDKTDKDRVDEAKPLAETALENITATNDTTGANILDAVNAGISSVDGVTATWKTGSPVVNKATSSKAGSITGTIILTCGSETVEVTVNKSINKLPAPTPEKPTITVGNTGSNYQVSSGKDMTLTCSGKLEDLAGIYVDGNLVDPSNYTLKSGSTILTLKASYLDTLSAGKHTLKFQYKDNVSAETEFTITAKSETTKPSSPQTGDTANTMLYFGLIALSGCALIFGLKKKKQSINNLNS